MPAGIEILNDTGDIVISSNGWLYNYVGQATFSSTVASPTSGDGVAGYSTHTITWAGSSIIVGSILPTSANTSYRLVSATKSGSTWTIISQRGNGSAPNAAGFLTETAATLFVWGSPSGASTFGASIYDGSGTLRADLSKLPLSMTGRGDFTSGSTSTTLTGSYGSIGGTIYPIILTAPTSEKIVQNGNGGYGSWDRSDYVYRFYRSGTTLYRTQTLQQFSSGFDDGPISNINTTTLPAQTVFFTDGFRFVAA